MDTPPELSAKDFEGIDACLAEGPEDWLSLGRAMDERSSALESPALQIVAAAFLYDLALGDGPRGAEHGPFVPMIASPEGTFPVPPKEAGPEVLDIWRTTFEEREDPILRSRIGDLLFVAQGSAAHEMARFAASALVEIATSSGWPPIYRAKAIARATEILATLNDSAGLATAVPVASELAEEFLEGEHPGPPFIVIRALIGLKAPSRPLDLDRLIDRAVTSFSEDHARERAYELAASSTDGERREAMRRAQL